MTDSEIFGVIDPFSLYFEESYRLAVVPWYPAFGEDLLVFVSSGGDFFFFSRTIELKMCHVEVPKTSDHAAQ